jgi:anti-sigma regulatory factor (Ser/Thr protein kinase)
VLAQGPEDTLELRLEPKLEAGAHARQALRPRFARELPEKTFADLLAVVTELVNNAVEHGPRRPIDLEVGLQGDLIHGEVRDQGDPAQSIPRQREATASTAGGRGLMLVEALTSDWWVRQGSTAVVFEMPVFG